jgi:signal transduction histidine kinase
VPGVDPLIGVVLVAWLASGLAAVCLTPRNGAARSLFAAGLLLSISAVTELLAGADGTGDTAFALLRTASWAAFLGAGASIVATLARIPDGNADARWHVWAARSLAVLAVTVPVLELLAAPTLALDDDAAARPNPVAVADLEPLADLATALRQTEPAWVLLGVALLGLRWWRGDAERRSELRWALRSIGLLGVLLLLVVVAEVAGGPMPPERLFAPLFLVSLALFPVALLVGITRRVRDLETGLLESRERLVNAEDVARRALERDLHDGVQQQLVAALSLVALAERQVSRRPEQSRATVAEVGERLRDAMKELRELVRGIRPPVLDDAGLVSAIESRLATLPVDVQLSADESASRRWPPAVESAAYFVVTEAVTNALKHAPGSRVVVHLCGADGRLRLDVSDDGPGLSPAASGGSGLRGLQDRVESLRGTFSVTGGDGGGTVVRAVFPGRGGLA